VVGFFGGENFGDIFRRGENYRWTAKIIAGRRDFSPV